MADYEYYGLFLTDKSKDKLNKWLWDNGYDWRLRNFRDNHVAYLLDGGW